MTSFSSFLRRHNSILNTIRLRRNMSIDGKSKIYITRQIPSEALEKLKDECIIAQWKEAESTVPRNELLQNVKGIHGLYCLLTDKIDKEVIGAAGPNLKVISTMSVGFNHIDLQTCKEQNIRVGYTPDVLTETTADLTVTLLLTVCRRITEAVAAVKDGKWGTWSPLWMCGTSLKGSTVGIYGFGRIGIATARRLKPFGVKEIIYSTASGSKPEIDNELGSRYVEFSELLEKSDFLLVTCSLTADSTGIFNNNAFNQMKKNSILINTSRGEVVEQNDLIDALRSGKIRAAGLDVTTPEPLPTDSELLQLNNCIVLPHIGSATIETRTQMALLAAENLLSGLKGTEMPGELKL
ncbi:unnamed protein product [Dimorphilus gyrociliatus]|uniref:Glyoxylate reductase/hydroxypyruvate reductase n=1 Tax=Dimorphilus gyrociliatus TaxID=2664684 RepID=A0A7I8W760_9ANNE|nr:unnamed protein product [Dimorphilus gyrociliatus]